MNLVRRYCYKVQGRGGNGDTWTAEGDLTASPGEFEGVLHAAMGAAFLKLTRGLATYGHPGKGGCKGPYTITHFTVEEAIAP